MFKYILKRLIAMIPVLIGVSLIVFVLLALTPGDAVTVMLGSGADEEAEAMLRQEFGLDRPFVTRYFNFLYDLFIKFDFGKSFRTRQPVMNEIIARSPVSLILSLSGVAFAALVGVPLGVFSAVKQYSFLDTSTVLFAILLSAIPVFWLGMILIYFLSFKAGWFPSFGIDSWKHFVLPALAIVIIYAARQMRYSRSSMLEAVRQDYVRTARAKGAPESSVIFNHALKNALLPILTVIGANVGALIGGAIVIEHLFSIPGLGSLVIIGINTRDLPVVIASTTTIAFFYCLVLLIVDLLYAVVDPRVKARYVR